jgi:two-component system OmpR family sensor kinase
LLTILLTLLVVALSASGYATHGLLRDYLLKQFDRQLNGSAASLTKIALDLNRGIDFLGHNGLPGDATVQFLLQDTGERATEGPSNEGTWPDLPPVSPALVSSHGGRPFTVGSVTGDRQWRVLAQTYRTGGGEVLYSEVALPMDQVTLTLARLRFVVLALGLSLLAACAALGWLAIRGAFVPLREVEDTAAAIAAGDLSRRVREHPPSTEVGRLTASLNGMLAQIEQAFRHREASQARTRRFAADASHELRTPLVSIRGFAELYRQGAVPPDEVPRTMRRIEDEATRMGGLVEDLLLLARLDEQRPGRSEPVDLAVLANDAVHDARGLDPTRRVSLVGLNGSAGPIPAVVIGDEDRLRQVVANLVANAVRHTPDGTAIEVAVGVTTNSPPGGAGSGVPLAVLEVRDHGPGLTEEQAERVFERFFRVDASRTRGQGGGSGLGLSIVSAVVVAHQGTVETRTTPGGGATFRVELPSRTPP